MNRCIKLFWMLDFFNSLFFFVICHCNCFILCRVWTNTSRRNVCTSHDSSSCPTMSCWRSCLRQRIQQGNQQKNTRLQADCFGPYPPPPSHTQKKRVTPLLKVKSDYVGNKRLLCTVKVPPAERVGSSKWLFLMDICPKRTKLQGKIVSLCVKLSFNLKEFALIHPLPWNEALVPRGCTSAARGMRPLFCEFCFCCLRKQPNWNWFKTKFLLMKGKNCITS